MDYKKLVKGLSKLYNTPETDVITMYKVITAIVDACSINAKADMALLQELRPMISNLSEIIKQFKKSAVLPPSNGHP